MKRGTFLKWLWSEFNSNADLTALCGDGDVLRIYPDVAPAGVANPCVVYQRIAGEFEDQLDEGAVKMGEQPVQMRCYGSTRADADAVLEAVRALFQNRATEAMGDGVRLEGTRVSDEDDTFDRETEDYGSLCVVTFFLGGE